MTEQQTRNIMLSTLTKLFPQISRYILQLVTADILVNYKRVEKQYEAQMIKRR